MPVVMLNPFTVFPGREDEFLALWDATNALFREKPGYVSARPVKALERQPPGEQAPFTHANIAEWESPEAYAAALRDIRIKRLADRYGHVCRLAPALYEIVHDVPARP